MTKPLEPSNPLTFQTSFIIIVIIVIIVMIIIIIIIVIILKYHHNHVNQAARPLDTVVVEEGLAERLSEDCTKFLRFSIISSVQLPINFWGLKCCYSGREPGTDRGAFLTGNF